MVLLEEEEVVRRVLDHPEDRSSRAAASSALEALEVVVAAVHNRSSVPYQRAD